MKNLYIFGDSFSTNFSTINEIELEESWPILLSNKLNYELKSYASPGISNYGILNKIYDNLDLTEIDKIKKKLDCHPFQKQNVKMLKMENKSNKIPRIHPNPTILEKIVHCILTTSNYRYEPED